MGCRCAASCRDRHGLQSCRLWGSQSNRERVTTGIQRHPHDNSAWRTHRVLIRHSLFNHARYLRGPLLGHILAHLSGHRLHAFFAHHTADLYGHLSHLLFGHHSHCLHRHFIFHAFDDLANGLYGHLSHLLFGHHAHRLDGHLLHDLFIDIPHGLYRHSTCHHAVDRRCFRHLHRHHVGLVHAIDLVHCNAWGDRPRVAPTLPRGKAVGGVHRPTAWHPVELCCAWGHHWRDRVDVSALVGVGRTHRSDLLGDAIRLLAFGGFVHRTTHEARLLLYRGFVDRLHDSESFFTGTRFNNIASDVVAHVSHLCFIHGLHHGESFFAGSCFPDGALYRVATFGGLRFPHRLCDGVNARIVDRFIRDTVGSHSLLIVYGLKIESVGLRRHRRCDDGSNRISAALSVGQARCQRCAQGSNNKESTKERKQFGQSHNSSPE